MGSPFETTAATLVLAAFFVLATSILACIVGVCVLRLRHQRADLKRRQIIALTVLVVLVSLLATGILGFGSVATVGVAYEWTYGKRESPISEIERILLISAIFAALYSVGRAVVTSIVEVTKSPIAQSMVASKEVPYFTLSVRIFALRARLAQRCVIAFLYCWVSPAAVLFSTYYESSFWEPVGLQLLAGFYVVAVPVVAGRRIFDFVRPEYQIANLLVDLNASGDDSDLNNVWKVARYSPKGFRGTPHRAGWKVAESLERYLSRSVRRLDSSERAFVLSGGFYIASQLRTAGRMADPRVVTELTTATLALLVCADQVRAMQELLVICPRVNPHVAAPSYDQPPAEAAIKSRIDRVIVRGGQFVPLMTDSLKLLGLLGLVVLVTYGLVADFSLDRLENLLRGLR